MQKISELLRIQITRSVNGSARALQWRMAIEMRQKNASEIKRRISSAVQSTPALQFQLIPSPSASRHGIIFHNDTSVQISPSLFFFLNHHIENNIQPFLLKLTLGGGHKCTKGFLGNSNTFNLLSELWKVVCVFQLNACRDGLCVCLPMHCRFTYLWECNSERSFSCCCDICSAPFYWQFDIVHQKHPLLIKVLHLILNPHTAIHTAGVI